MILILVLIFTLFKSFKFTFNFYLLWFSGYSCALVSDILLQGHLYLTENYFAFYSNVFGYVTKVRLPTHVLSKILKRILIKTDFPHHLHRITWRMCFWSYNLITFLFYDQILVTNTHTVSNNRYERENSKNYPQRNRPDDNGAREACFLIFHIKRYNFQTYDEIMETSNERPWRTGSVYCKYQI